MSTRAVCVRDQSCANACVQVRQQEDDVATLAVHTRELLALVGALRMCGASSMVVPLALMKARDVNVVMTGLYGCISEGISLHEVRGLEHGSIVLVHH